MQKLVRGAALALTLVSGMLTTTAPAWAQEAFRIAGVLPLSGAFGIIGENMRRGVTIAIEERNSRVLGKPIEVTWTTPKPRPRSRCRKPRALSRAKCTRCSARSARARRWP